MENNPFVTVPSPNYAGPMVNFGNFGNQNQQPQQNGQNPWQRNPQQQQNPQQQDWITRLRAWLQQRQQQPQQPGQMGPQAYGQPGAPLNLTPGSVAGANQLTAGLY
jgi:hypothetical protein